MILGIVVYRELQVKDLPRILWDSLVHTLRVMFIIASAGFFGWFMIHQRIPQQIITTLTALTWMKWLLILIIIFILIVLGCFLEGIAVLVITIPVFMPLIERYGIDPVQFGVIMILCSMIGLLTPPVGMSLYAVSSISGISIGLLTKEMWPYLLGIFLVLLVMSFFPEVCLWLPNTIMGPD
jgi:tripartite ATP-independent transporter DctM subunit